MPIVETRLAQLAVAGLLLACLSRLWQVGACRRTLR